MTKSNEFDHTPVMLDEVVALFGPVPDGRVVDATLGGAGHATALLDAHPGLSIIGLDRDPSAIEAATARLAPYGERARVHRVRFDALADVVAADGRGPVSGVLFDLGVSSPQLDRGDRGFAFRHDGPLDMRMDPTTGRSASDIVNQDSVDAIAQILRDGGEERWAFRIAKAIVASRPIETTGQLAELVRNAIPAAARRKGGHPATRTFQALRVPLGRRPHREAAFQRSRDGRVLLPAAVALRLWSRAEGEAGVPRCPQGVRGRTRAEPSCR